MNEDFRLVLSENVFQRKGCASSLRYFCKNCGWKHEILTSKKRTFSYEVNGRLVYSMSYIGKGYSEAEKFLHFKKNASPPTPFQQQGHIRKMKEQWQRM